MNTLRTIIWVILAVMLVVFSIFNWETTNVRFWPGMLLETKLPVLILGAFLLGSLPMWLAYKTTKFQYRRKLTISERELETLRTREAAPVSTPVNDLTAPVIPEKRVGYGLTTDDTARTDPARTDTIRSDTVPTDTVTVKK